MTKFLAIAGIAAGAVMMSFTGKNMHGTNYNADTKASKVEWYAEKVTGKHNGTVNLASGMLTDNHGQWTGTFEIDMTSISNTDMQAGQGKEKLEGHLKSPDFFDTEKFGKAKLVVSSITPLEKPADGMTHTVKGFLTIKDKSNPVEFKTAITAEGGRMICTGAMVVDRSKYDVRYGSKSFFNDLGDKAIMDEFTLKFNIVLGS